MQTLKRLLSAFEETFPRRYGFYRSVSCSLCSATTSEHDAAKIWHTHNCLVREVREKLENNNGQPQRPDSNPRDPEDQG